MTQGIRLRRIADEIPVVADPTARYSLCSEGEEELFLERAQVATLEEGEACTVVTTRDGTEYAVLNRIEEVHLNLIGQMRGHS